MPSLVANDIFYPHTAQASQDDECYDVEGNYICEGGAPDEGSGDESDGSADEGSSNDNSKDDNSDYCADEDGEYTCYSGPPDVSPDDEPPDDTLPDDTLPDDTLPDDTLPDDTLPDDTLPDDTLPDDTLPDDIPPICPDVDKDGFCDKPQGEPVADAGPNLDITEGESVSIDGSGSNDPDGEELKYNWKQADEDENGPDLIFLDNGDKEKLQIRGPEVDWDIAYAVQLTVTDKGGLIDSDNMILSVIDSDSTPDCYENPNYVGPCPPIAKAGPDRTIKEGQILILDGSSSNDVGGWIESYCWSQKHQDGPNLIFPTEPCEQKLRVKIPQVQKDITYTITLTAVDNEGDYDVDSMKLVVEDSDTSKKGAREATTTKTTTIATKSRESNYQFAGKIGFPGTAKGQILEPTDIAIDSSHNILYVTDKDNNRISIFGTTGNYITSWGSEGSGKGQFKKPGDLAADFSEGLIFVSDIGNNRIQKFDTEGNFLGMWGSTGKGPGQFDHVGDITLDSQGKIVYVTDIGNHRMQKFDYDGIFNGSWGALGNGDGQLDRPAGLAYDSGIVFVADTNNNRIQKFDKDGNFVGKWGTFGTGQGQFDNPVSITLDSESGYVYVTHGGSLRIQVFDKQGKYVDSWGPTGIDNGQFKRAVSVAFGNEDKIYVVDKDKSEIQIFKLSYDNQPSQQKTTISKTTTIDTSESDTNSPTDYRAQVYAQLEDSCWNKVIVKITDGPSGKTLAKKTIMGDATYDDNETFISTSLRFDGEKVNSGEIAVYVDVGEGNSFASSVYTSQDFDKNQKNYNFKITSGLDTDENLCYE